MTMNWDDMRVFLAVARDGSLSAAARHLKVTQPTVGRRLGQLESDLGTRLFDRLPDGFVPTQAGEELLPIAEDMEKAAHALQRRQATLADTVSGTVRLSVFEVPAQFMTIHLPAIRANLPEIEIELSVNHMNANLSRREADLVLQVCLPDTPGLIARKLGELSYAVYGSRAYVAATPAARGNKRYQDCEWVAFDDDHVYFDGQTGLREKLAGRAPAIRMNNGHAIHDAVRNGAGLGVLPCFAGDSDPDLVRLTAPIQGVESDLNLVVHRDLKRVPSVRAVMDELIRLFKQEAPRLAGRSKREAA
ncbi:MAG: LysR family transcriptional regulator [Pseudomonadota bacterium]|nr:LysR family transcriptional regulator [Pseudomonadota bacterium]MEC8202133.1 LysR family transcriptional regulator [Pseudomonadota bacterium]